MFAISRKMRFVSGKGRSFCCAQKEPKRRSTQQVDLQMKNQIQIHIRRLSIIPLGKKNENVAKLRIGDVMVLQNGSKRHGDFLRPPSEWVEFGRTGVGVTSP